MLRFLITLEKNFLTQNFSIVNTINRELFINQLKEQAEWDVAIIGGGATGLGIALDSVSRGFKTVLVEGVD